MNYEDEMTDATPPNSVEAEQSFLGGLMMDNSTWADVSKKVSADDFYREDHRLIFKSIEGLAENKQPFD